MAIHRYFAYILDLLFDKGVPDFLKYVNTFILSIFNLPILQ